MCKYWALISKADYTIYAGKQIRHKKKKKKQDFWQHSFSLRMKCQLSSVCVRVHGTIKSENYFLITKLLQKKDTFIYSNRKTVLRLFYFMLQDQINLACNFIVWLNDAAQQVCLIHCRRARFSGGGLLGVGGAGLAGPGGAGGFVSFSSCGLTVSCGTSGSFFTSTIERKWKNTHQKILICIDVFVCLYYKM